MMAVDIMSKDLVTGGPSHSIVHAAQIMLDNKVNGLPVIGDDAV
jgi:CBS domain-containing protein